MSRCSCNLCMFSANNQPHYHNSIIIYLFFCVNSPPVFSDKVCADTANPDRNEESELTPGAAYVRLHRPCPSPYLIRDGRKWRSWPSQTSAGRESETGSISCHRVITPWRQLPTFNSEQLPRSHGSASSARLFQLLPCTNDISSSVPCRITPIPSSNVELSCDWYHILVFQFNRDSTIPVSSLVLMKYCVNLILSILILVCPVYPHRLPCQYVKYSGTCYSIWAAWWYCDSRCPFIAFWSAASDYFALLPKPWYTGSCGNTSRFPQNSTLPSG